MVNPVDTAYANWQVDFSPCRGQATLILPQEPHPRPLPDAEAHSGDQADKSHYGEMLLRRGGAGFSWATREGKVQSGTHNIALEDLPIRTVVAQQH